MSTPESTTASTPFISPDEPLSFQQLVFVSHIISTSNIEKVARELRVSDEALKEIQMTLRQQALNPTAQDRNLLILEAWKSEQATKCTLNNLKDCLKSINLNKTAFDLEKLEKDGPKLDADLGQDNNCQSTVEIDGNMAYEVSKIVRGAYYKGLGFQLGLEPEEMEEVITECKAENSPPSKYVEVMLKRWIQKDGPKAVLGKLYKALRILQCNDMANKVYAKCEKIAKDNA